MADIIERHILKLDDSEITQRYPHYPEYKRCQQNAFLSGSFTMAGAGSCIYILADQAYKRFKPDISRSWVLASSILAGCGIAYIVTWRKTVNCSNMWMSMEDKHSVLSPIEEKKMDE